MSATLNKQTEPVLIEEIPLLRAGEIVSSLAGAFGRSMREPRLTALLGYLIALAPSDFGEVFGFKGIISSVALETVGSKQRPDGPGEKFRSDILITTPSGMGVVEAKLDATDLFIQSDKYLSGSVKWRVLLTQYRPSLKQQKERDTVYLTWEDLARVFSKLSKSSNARIRFVSTDLLRYLEEHHMIRKENSVEVYAREINEPLLLELFLAAHLYGCAYKKSSRLSEAHYFAPHFGERIAKEYPGTRVGISYLSRIEAVEVCDRWAELRQIAKRIRGATWVKKHADLLKTVKKCWDWKNPERRSLVFRNRSRICITAAKTGRLLVGSGR
jgi:hypothetical protein